MQSLSKISILVSLVMIAIAIWMHVDLHQEFNMAEGKDKALFGMKHMMKMPYAFIGGFALILSIITILKQEKVKIVMVTFSLAIFSIVLLMLDLYRWF